MPGITNGAELIKALRESGTPDCYLNPGRQKLVEIHEKEKRTATAMEVGSALETALGEHHGTVKKAAHLVQTGELPKSDKIKVNQIEDRLLAGGTPGITYDEMQSIGAKPSSIGSADPDESRPDYVKEKSVGPPVANPAGGKEKPVGPVKTK